MQRRFKEETGLTIKEFIRIRRIRSSLIQLMLKGEDYQDVIYESGYFDQAHFIREFKLFLKETPSNYKKTLKESDDNSKIINYNFKLF